MALEVWPVGGLVAERQPGMAESLNWSAVGRLSQGVVRARTADEGIANALAVLIDGGVAAAVAVWVYEPQGGRLVLAGERGLPSEGDQRPVWPDQAKLPLNSGGLLIGVLEAYSDHRDGFTDDQRGALQLLAGLLSVSLHRHRADGEAGPGGVDQERLDELELLWKLTRETEQAISYPALFESLLRCLGEVLPFDAAALLLAGGAHPECTVALRRHGHRGLIDELTRRTAAAFGSYATFRPVIDLTTLRVIGEPDEDAAALPLGHGFAVPLAQGDAVVGVIYVAAVGETTFSEGQVRVLHRFAQHASASMDRVRNLIAIEMERLETIIASLPQGVVLLDRDGHILLQNRHGRRRLGLLGVDGKAVHRLHDLALDGLVREAVASGIDLVRREVEVRHGDRTFHLSLTVVPVRDEEELVGVVLSIEDITEIRQTEQRLFHDARLASIGEFASGLAHELNNPMMIILGIAEVLGEDSDLPEPKQALLADMQEATLRAADIVKQLMVFADTQRDAGWDALDLAEVLEQALSLVASQCERDGITVHREWADDVPMVEGNAGKLQQLVLGLLRNAGEAIVHSGVGGRVEIRTRVEQGEVLVEVEDDGPGVPAELRNKIFDVFFTTKRDYQGKGLGLSVAHRIALEHNGTLTVHPASGRGSLFRLTLPACRLG